MDNQFASAESAIAERLEEAFAAIEREVKATYFSTSDPDLELLRSTAGNFAINLIENKNFLLLDTALNYLSSDALKALEGAEPKALNQFIDSSQNLRSKLKSELSQSFKILELSLSADPRIVYAAGAGVVGGGLIGLIGRQLLGVWGQLAFTAAAGLLAFKTTYQKTLPIATKRVEEDLMEYIRQSREATSESLQRTIDNYRHYFRQFTEGSLVR